MNGDVPRLPIGIEARGLLATQRDDEYFSHVNNTTRFTLVMLIIADSKIPNVEIAFHQFGEVRMLRTSEMTNANIKDATAILVRSETPVNESLLKHARVKFVGTATIGTDHVDLDYLQQCDIGFASCPGSNANSVSEYVLAALLEMAEQYHFSLRGKILGVIGHGNTGSRVAIKAEALGMKVLLNDPPLARATLDPRYLHIGELMDADIISLHVPLTRSGEDATFHLVNEQRLSAMKRGSILINSSRGAVAETEALKQAIISEHLLTCVLDVWENEPRIDTDLLGQTSIGTPHIAGYSFDGKLNATSMLQRAIGSFFNMPMPEQKSEMPSELNELALPERTNAPESLLAFLVRQCYDIREDDRRLRRVISMTQEDRAAYFRKLRAEYPIRREFHNAVVDGTELDEETQNMLAAIGFAVRTMKDAA